MDFFRGMFIFIGLLVLMGIIAIDIFTILLGGDEQILLNDNLATPGDIAMIAVAVIGSVVIFVVTWAGLKILGLQSRRFTRRLLNQDADHQKNYNLGSTEQEQECIEENHPLNKSSSRIIQYSGIFLLSLFVSYLVFSFANRYRNIEQTEIIEQAENIQEAENIEQAREIEQAADINIVGMWQSEPILGQLGLGQSSYTFNADSSYSNKLDMISFCKGSYGQDCEYFWMIFDGTYSVKNGVITLFIKEAKAVRLQKGQSKPEIKVQTDYPKSDVYMVKLEAGNLILTGIKDDESVIYKPFVDTEQDEAVPSVDARNVEQATDIVGVWQSEAILGPVGLIQSSYTFTADGSYSNKVDNLRLCKDVPEQNCEYYWTLLDGKYAVKNGVVTLYTKEVRAEIMRKGESKPDIRIAPDRPYSGDVYRAKLDAGKLFMTSVNSDETVVFKPVNDD